MKSIKEPDKPAKPVRSPPNYSRETESSLLRMRNRPVGPVRANVNWSINVRDIVREAEVGVGEPAGAQQHEGVGDEEARYDPVHRMLPPGAIGNLAQQNALIEYLSGFLDASYSFWPVMVSIILLNWTIAGSSLQIFVYVCDHQVYEEVGLSRISSQVLHVLIDLLSEVLTTPCYRRAKKSTNPKTFFVLVISFFGLLQLVGSVLCTTAAYKDCWYGLQAGWSIISIITSSLPTLLVTDALSEAIMNQVSNREVRERLGEWVSPRMFRELFRLVILNLIMFNRPGTHFGMAIFHLMLTLFAIMTNLILLLVGFIKVPPPTPPTP